MDKIENGIWKMAFGRPEELTPVKCLRPEMRTQALANLPECVDPPFGEAIKFKETKRGCLIELPLCEGEQIYGFGLQLKSFNQRGKKKQIRVNADPVADSGDSHAPVPFFASTRGYAVLLDTYRYASFYCGSGVRKAAAAGERNGTIGGNTEELYAVSEDQKDGVMLIEVPHAQGAELIIFGGPDMLTAVRRYVLFSGGGCLPPVWGLGVLYRAYAKADGAEVLSLARQIREDSMPCDMLGLEPGWQSHSYPCSFKWDDGRFPDPDGLVRELGKMGMRANVWEHAFLHPTSPLYQEFTECSGDFRVFGGLAPDFLDAEASRRFASYHKEVFLDKGVSGFKLDECDNSDYTGSWSFPECSEFPSGLDGEQMHSAFGLLYQRSVLSAAEAAGNRTYGQVRSSHALASTMPFVLYSDLYEHRDFIRGLVNMGFSGLLWSPEVRQCDSPEDLVRRLQTVVLSPQAVINAWMIPSPPWKQVDYEKNLAGEMLENMSEVQDECRFWLEFRMRLIPYLYSAFARYAFEGMPPFRALVMDYPGDANVFGIDDEYMMGESVLVAPMVAGQQSRKVYLPEGGWYCFWTGKKYAGGISHEISSTDKIPVFVRENSLLPLAKPVLHTSENMRFDLDVYCYGAGVAKFTLYEDDFQSLSYANGEMNRVTLTYSGGTGRTERSGSYEGTRYNIKDWIHVV